MLLRFMLVVIFLLTTHSLRAGDTIKFNRDIKPILAEYCIHCHGPDKETREADLRLDTAEGAYRDLGGYAAIKPGDSADSESIIRILTKDKDEVMPPPKSKKKMKQHEIDLLKKWIDGGAKYEKHWAFEKPESPAVPPVSEKDWVKNDIDPFVFAELEKAGLRPNQETDRATLLRRVSFDLTGLPPTPEAVRAFVNDQDADAYEKVVEKLLSSPRYGEHMARYWLDLVRYADTHGLHLDNYREMWAYRDWVIKAFNQNMPYDQFAVEQIAGDLLPGSTEDQKIASGFNRLHVTTNEGGSIKEEVYVRNVVERTVGYGTTFLSLTLDCARCHDHKFDPIKMKDFYSLFAFFNNLDANPLDGNRKDHAPVLKVMTDELKAKLAHLDGQIAKLVADRKGDMPAVDLAQSKWEQSLLEKKEDKQDKPFEWQVVTPESFTSSSGATLSKQDDGAVLVSGENPAKDVHEITSVIKGQFKAIRLEALLEKGKLGRGANGNVVLSGIEAEVRPVAGEAQWTPVKFHKTWADYSQNKFPVKNAIDGKQNTGWAVDGHAKKKQTRMAYFYADKKYGFEGGTRLRVKLNYESPHAQHVFARVRLSTIAVDPKPGSGPQLTLDNWYAAGPFGARDLKQAFSKKFGPEGKKFNSKQKFEYGHTWKQKPSWRDGQVQYDLKGNSAATYLYRKIRSPSSQEVTLSFGSDDAIKVWLNGKQILARQVTRAAEPDQDKVKVKLNKGDNHLMMKVVNGGGGYGFYFAVVGMDTGIPGDILQIAALESAKRTPKQVTRIRDYYREKVASDTKLMAINKEIVSTRNERNKLQNTVATTLIYKERKDIKPAYMLIRGEYDKRGDKVDRATPGFLHPMNKELPVNRLGLAKWTVDPANPLVARVAMNRFWQQCFGTGLVKTSEDFGNQGEWPSHPELLDKLAVDFVEGGWDIKAMMKKIVMSAAYRQHASLTQEKFTQDPENRLLSRGPRFRLDAEMLRDQALAVSGLLNNKLGGPSVKPPQPSGIWFAVGYTNSNTAKFEPDSGAEKVHRRSLYTFWKRTAVAPQMSTFDAPTREACAVRRERTNTPLQALLMMNDPQYLEAARALAQRVILKEKAVDARIVAMFELASGRTPNAWEVGVIKADFDKHLAHYSKQVDAAKKLLAIGEFKHDAQISPSELAAWTMTANLLLNLDEVINKN